MAKTCLACGAVVAQIFEPCAECGTRPTDPYIREGISKEQYDREHGAYDFNAALAQRRKAAGALKEDLVTEVPMLYGQTPFAAPDEVINKAHQADMVRKNKGGISRLRLYSGQARLPFEKVVLALVVLTGLINVLS